MLRTLVVATVASVSIVLTVAPAALAAAGLRPGAAVARTDAGDAARAPAASVLRLRDTGETPSIVRGDGDHRLAMVVDDGFVTVLDTRSQTFSRFPTPAGCGFADAHHATLLWSCRSAVGFASGVSYDIATGAEATLPPYVAGTGGALGARYGAIGDRFARIDIDAYHADNAYAYVERATGVQSYTNVRFGQARDLDQPGLLRPLCAGHLEPVVQGGIDLEPGEPAAAGGWTAATTISEPTWDTRLTRIQIQRCGTTRARTIRVCSTVTCSEPVLDDRIITWERSAPSCRGHRDSSCATCAAVASAGRRGCRCACDPSSSITVSTRTRTRRGSSRPIRVAACCAS
jgi:hypothetical protein